MGEAREGMMYYARVEGERESMLEPEEEAGTSMKDEKKRRRRMMNKTYEWLINNYSTSLHEKESVLELKYGWNYIQAK